MTGTTVGYMKAQWTKGELEAVREAQRAEIARVAAEHKLNMLDFGDAMAELKQLDPAGWETWYNENVPEWKSWDTVSAFPILCIVRRRVHCLKLGEC